MKWYNSIKTKMIGFFLLISILFLASILVVFFKIREERLYENASREVTLLTTKMLQELKEKQLKAEDTVLTLARIESGLKGNKDDTAWLFKTILSGIPSQNLDILSGGIWLEKSNSEIPSGIYFKNSGPGTFTQISPESITKFKQSTVRQKLYTLAQKTKAGEVVWSEVYSDPLTHKRIITALSPIYIDGHFAGAADIDLAIDYDIDKIAGNEHLNISDDGYFMILDKAGNYICRSPRIRRVSKNAPNIFDAKQNGMQSVLKIIAPSLEHKDESSLCEADSNVTIFPKGLQHSSDIESTLCFVKNDTLLGTDSVLAIFHFPGTHWNMVVGIPQNQVLAHTNSIFYKILLITTILTLLATLLGYLLLKHIFITPINRINEQLKGALSENTLLECRDKGEIGLLVDNLNTRTRNLEQAKARENREHELRLEQQEMLMQQSKMAMVGEMMDSVAHQWKQPLNALMLYSELIRNDFEEGKVDKAYVEEFRKNLQVQIDHMVNTLDEFRSFFRPNKEREHFNLLDVVNSALFLAKDDILKNRILVKMMRQDEIEIYGYPNEFKHLILNIINNAKDAFVDNEVKQRLIKINLIASELGDRLEICDNAGGIPESVIDRIFEANVTTKEEGKGTGIGLYMSQQIAQKHQAKITAENRNGGACFIVTFNYDLKKKPLSRKDIR